MLDSAPPRTAAAAAACASSSADDVVELVSNDADASRCAGECNAPWPPLYALSAGDEGASIDKRPTPKPPLALTSADRVTPYSGSVRRATPIARNRTISARSMAAVSAVAVVTNAADADAAPKDDDDDDDDDEEDDDDDNDDDENEDNGDEDDK